MPWLFLLAAWVFALVLVSVAYARWNQAGLSLHLQVTASIDADPFAAQLPESLLRTAPMANPLFDGDRAEIETGLDTSGGARGPAWLRGQVGAISIEATTGVVPKAGWRVRLVTPSLPRGPLGATAWKVGSSDPLGFFGGDRACADAEVGLVMPRFGSLRGHGAARELEAAQVTPRAGSGTEPYGVREYVAGDSLRRIHWRTSARHGSLIVREFEPPGRETVGIYCDPEPLDRETADQIARIAASEAWDCVREGGRVVLWTPGRAPTPVADAREFWPTLEWLARYPDGLPVSKEEPGSVSQAVWVVGRPNRRIDPRLETVRRRGGLVRGWLVGASDDSRIADPHSRAGLEWPL